MKSILFFVFILFVTFLEAQEINYKALAINKDGSALINKDIVVKIEIIKEDLITITYSEQHKTTTNNLGLFSILIGKGKVIFGNFEEVDLEQDDLYIKIYTDIDSKINFQLFGISQLLKKPTAFYAEKIKLSVGTHLTIDNSGKSNSKVKEIGSKWSSHRYGIYNDTSNIGIGITPMEYVPLNVNAANYNNTGNGIAHFKSADKWHSSIGIFNGLGLNEKQFSFILAGPANSNAANGTFGLYNHQSTSWSFNVNPTNNFFAIGSNNNTVNVAKSKLHVFAGDINIDQIGSGIIMKSPNGACWRITIDDTGNLIRTAIICP
jgi:hypothetical protein